MASEDSAQPLLLDTHQQQHMLFLFFPIKKGALPEAMAAMEALAGGARPQAAAEPGADHRAETGVHFFMIYGLEANEVPHHPKVPSFRTVTDKDLLVVLSIYDRDFAPYISAFTRNPVIAGALDGILSIMDEAPSIDPLDPTSAYYIFNNGGVAENNLGFLALLMRYNFADPTIPGSTSSLEGKPKYVLSATFPGLTVASILKNYPDADTIWPSSPRPIIFEPSCPPPTVEDLATGGAAGQAEALPPHTARPTAGRQES